MAPQFHVQHTTKCSPCAGEENPNPSAVHLRYYLHCCHRVRLKLRYLRTYSSPRVVYLRVQGLYVPDSHCFGTIHHMSDGAFTGHCVGPSFCWPLADLQHIGVDMEADVGEVLLRTESWDVTAYLLGRGKTEKNAGNGVSDTNNVNQSTPIIALQETLCTVQINLCFCSLVSSIMHRSRLGLICVQ